LKYTNRIHNYIFLGRGGGIIGGGVGQGFIGAEID